jgi:hypothetical protein
MPKIRAQIRARTYDSFVRFCDHSNVIRKKLSQSSLTRKALSADRTDSLIRRIVESAFNQGALAVVDELLAPDGITHIASWACHTLGKDSSS